MPSKVVPLNLLPRGWLIIMQPNYIEYSYERNEPRNDRRL